MDDENLQDKIPIFGIDVLYKDSWKNWFLDPRDDIEMGELLVILPVRVKKDHMVIQPYTLSVPKSEDCIIRIYTNEEVLDARIALSYMWRRNGRNEKKVTSVHALERINVSRQIFIAPDYHSDESVIYHLIEFEVKGYES